MTRKRDLIDKIKQLERKCQELELALRSQQGANDDLTEQLNDMRGQYVLEWREDVPADGGWYWRRRGNLEPKIVWLDSNRHQNFSHPNERGCLWAGPIVMPECDGETPHAIFNDERFQEWNRLRPTRVGYAS